MFRTMTLIAVLALSGCQTPYQEEGLTGGVQAQQLTSDTFRISAQGNGYTSSTTIQDYVLLKAAETTVAQGRAKFVVLNAADTSQNSTYTTPGSMQTNVYGNTAFTTFSPGTTTNVTKPGADVMIRTVPPGVDVPGSFDAAELIRFIGSRVVRPGTANKKTLPKDAR